MKRTIITILTISTLLPASVSAQENQDNGIIDKVKSVFAAPIKIGTYTFRDGAVYTGELKSKKPNGKGKTTFPTGDVYEGEYVKGKRQGTGTYVFTDGEKYEGELFQDQ